MGFRVKMGAFFEGQWSIRTWANGFPMSPEEDIEMLYETGIRTICLQVYEVYRGELYYRSRRYPELSFPASDKSDFLARYIRAAKRKNMEVWIWSSEKGMPRGSALYKKFQNCLELDQDGQDNSSWDHNYPCMCINSPWRQFLKNVYSEILTEFPIDCIVVSDESGFNDAVRWGGYCPYCSSLFEKETGEKPPTIPQWEDRNSLWWDFLRMKMDWWHEYIEDLSSVCKEVRPQTQTAVIINENVLYSTLKSLDWWRIYEIPSLDAVGSDTYYRIFTQDHATHVGFIGDFMTSINKGRKRTFLTTPAYRTISPADVKLGAFNAVLSGADDVFFYNMGYLRDYEDKRMAAGEVNQTVHNLNTSLRDAKAFKHAGVVFSKREWMGPFAENAEHLLAEAIGLYQALMLTGTPVNVIGDDILLCEQSLKDFKVILLPQPFELTKEVAANLFNWVSEGGSLILSLLERNPTGGSVDPWGRIFGVEISGTTDQISVLKGKGSCTDLVHEIFQWPIVQHTAYGGYPAVDRKRGILSAEKPYEVLFENISMEGQCSEAIISREIGKGKVVVSTEDLGSGISALMAKGWGCESLWLQKALNLARIIQALTRSEQDNLPFSFNSDTPNVVTRLYEKEHEYVLVIINHDVGRKATVDLKLDGVSGQIEKQITIEPADTALVAWDRV